MITQGTIKEWLDYNPDTGEFRWKVSRSRNVKIGQIAGHNNGKNAWRITVDWRGYLAHRLAWFYVYGIWPNQIDHINGDRMDNRICNLREANNSQNQANMKAKSNSRLGIRGVGFRNGKYIVQLRKNKFYIRASFGNYIHDSRVPF